MSRPDSNDPLPPDRTLAVGALARVEGEGALRVELRDGQLHDVQLRIFEPPRFFEAFLRGRSYTEPPDITARICGICPVAYQMSACLALEDACGVTVDGPLRDLRRLLYCGEWIESHALHVHLLHAPDFLGAHSALELAEHHRSELERGLELKKLGNDLVALLGGRAVHPVNVRLGGFYRVPSRRELAAFRPSLERARDLAVEVVDWVAGFEFPDFTHAHPLVALSSPEEYAVVGGRIVSNTGMDVAVQEVDRVIDEHHVPHSTALHGRLSGGGQFLVGPLARFALGFDRLRPAARDAAVRVGVGPGERNPFRSIVVRAVEVVQACEEALALVDGYEEPDAPAVVVPARAGIGYGATEAPRGLLWHRYELAEDGTILDARIVPPTSQNQPTIEHDLGRFVVENLALDDAELTRRCEQAIRNYDPCISCATHFLDVEVVEG